MARVYVGSVLGLSSEDCGRHQFHARSHRSPSSMLESYLNLRVATPDDVVALRALIETSARGLSAGFYSPEQIEAAVVHVFGVDTQLITDGTYFVIDAADGPAAAGGWSARRTLYGGDQTKSGIDTMLDPRTDAARIRAFFV